VTSQDVVLILCYRSGLRAVHPTDSRLTGVRSGAGRGSSAVWKWFQTKGRKDRLSTPTTFEGCIVEKQPSFDDCEISQSLRSCYAHLRALPEYRQRADPLSTGHPC
jgi:hypothetical protein